MATVRLPAVYNDTDEFIIRPAYVAGTGRFVIISHVLLNDGHAYGEAALRFSSRSNQRYLLLWPGLAQCTVPCRVRAGIRSSR